MIECPKNWMVDINHNHSFHSATWKFFHFPLSLETCLLLIEMVKRKYPSIKQSTPPVSCTMYLYEVLMYQYQCWWRILASMAPTSMLLLPLSTFNKQLGDVKYKQYYQTSKRFDACMRHYTNYYNWMVYFISFLMQKLNLQNV